NPCTSSTTRFPAFRSRLIVCAERNASPKPATTACLMVSVLWICMAIFRSESLHVEHHEVPRLQIEADRVRGKEREPEARHHGLLDGLGAVDLHGDIPIGIPARRAPRGSPPSDRG